MKATLLLCSALVACGGIAAEPPPAQQALSASTDAGAPQAFECAELTYSFFKTGLECKPGAPLCGFGPNPHFHAALADAVIVCYCGDAGLYVCENVAP